MKFSDLNWQDIFDRALWTFAQAFVATAVVAGTNVVSANLWETAALSGVAAVLAFLKNTVFQARAAGQQVDQGLDPPPGE